MSILSVKARRTIVFDADNLEHRQWYCQYVKTGKWTHCPVKFEVDDDTGTLVDFIERKLLRYYLNQEFSADIRI
jgi:hypothetical protein